MKYQTINSIKFYIFNLFNFSGLSRLLLNLTVHLFIIEA